MKLGHASALVLAGWCLIAPPFDTAGNVFTNAPLTQWQVIGRFDSAPACQTAKATVTQKLHAEADRLQKNMVPPTAAKKHEFNHADNMASRAAASVCVSTDDPRLTGKYLQASTDAGLSHKAP